MHNLAHSFLQPVSSVLKIVNDPANHIVASPQKWREGPENGAFEN